MFLKRGHPGHFHDGTRKTVSKFEKLGPSPGLQDTDIEQLDTEN